MKQLLILHFALLISFLLPAQTFLFFNEEGEQYADTVFVFGSPSDIEINQDVFVKNNTDHPISMKVKRERIEWPEGTESYFCLGDQCYPPTVDDSPIPLLLDAGETSGEHGFIGHYAPQGMNGTNIDKYTFYNAEDDLESSQLVLVYNPTVSGLENVPIHQFSFYPNPASTFIHIRSQGRIRGISIYDLAGKEVFKTNELAESDRMNIEFLVSGVYLVKVISENSMDLKKLIVQ